MSPEGERFAIPEGVVLVALIVHEGLELAVADLEPVREEGADLELGVLREEHDSLREDAVSEPERSERSLALEEAVGLWLILELIGDSAELLDCPRAALGVAPGAPGCGLSGAAQGDGAASDEVVRWTRVEGWLQEGLGLAGLSQRLGELTCLEEGPPLREQGFSRLAAARRDEALFVLEGVVAHASPTRLREALASDAPLGALNRFPRLVELLEAVAAALDVCLELGEGFSALTRGLELARLLDPEARQSDLIVDEGLLREAEAELELVLRQLGAEGAA